MIRKIRNITLLVIALSSFIPAFSQIQFKNVAVGEQCNFFEMNRDFISNIDSNFDNRKGSKVLRRWQYFWNSRVDSLGFAPNAIDLYRQFKQNSIFGKNHSPLSSKNWIELGPRSPQIGANKSVVGSGRINCIEFSPLDSNVIWAGSASGGLWKSADLGKSWQVVPFTEFLSIGISDIAIPPSDPKIMYAATGDADGGSFFGCYSIGLIKSSDAGNSWELLDLGLAYQNGDFISKVIVSPNNSNIIYVATNRSILKSSDAGKTWAEILGGNNFRDLLFKPDDSSVIYATSYELKGGANIFKSEDSGETWYIVKNYPQANRIKLAVTSLDPEFLLALASDKNTNSFHSLDLSRSAGIAWQKLLNDTADYNFLVQAQGFFNLLLEFSPQQKNEFYIGGVWLYKGNVNSNDFIAAPADIHVDMHDLKFNAQNGMLYLANDGGIYRGDKDLSKFENISNNLGITQFYRLGINPRNERIIYAGSQDNNVFEWFYDNWNYYWGGDGMECFVDSRNPSLVYFSTQRGSLYSSALGALNIPAAEAKPWVTSFLPNPLNNDVLFCGYENIWKSLDRGLNWEKITDFKDKLTITSIAISTMDTNLIAAANSQNAYQFNNRNNLWDTIYTAKSYISSLKYNNSNRLWIACGRFVPSEKVLLYDNGTIINHTYNLPNVPVNCIEIDTLSGRIYIGTDLGVFDKMPQDSLWHPTGNNLPAVIVNELQIHYGTGDLFAATFGRGIWKINIFECNCQKPEIIQPEKTYFCFGQTMTLQIKNPNKEFEYTWTDGSNGNDLQIRLSGTYYVSARNPNGCISGSDSILIWKPSNPSINLILVSANPICEGDTARAKAIVNISQSIKNSGWSNGQKSQNANFASTGNYYYWLEDQYGCFKFSDTINIVVNPKPNKPIITKQGHWLTSSRADRYVWFRNGQILENNKGESCYIFEPGDYVVLTRDSNYCSDESDVFRVSFSGDSSSKIQCKLFPNPSNGLFNLELNLLKNSEIRMMLYNSIGEQIEEINYPASEGFVSDTIDLTKYGQGYYYLRIVGHYGETGIVLVKIE